MLGSQRQFFDIPDDVTYLNCAYMSPQLKSVTEAGIQAVRQKAQPWRISADDFFGELNTARELFSQLVGATPECIAVIPSVSYGTSIAAANTLIGPREQIVMLAEQFPSNVYAWRQLARQSGAEVVTVRTDDYDWTGVLMKAINERTAVVAIPTVHWTDGSRVDIAAIGKRCREVSALLVVDATQSLGAMPLNVRDAKPDFLIAAAYKWLLGPYSLGFMYVDPAHHGGKPIEYGWLNRKMSEDFSGLVRYRDEYQAGACRFDVGEASNFILLPMANEAMRQVIEWEPRRIADTIGAMTSQITDKARKLGIGTAPSGRRARHMMGLNFDGGVPASLTAALDKNNVSVSVRGSSIRISPHVYNDAADLERLFDALEHGYRPNAVA